VIRERQAEFDLESKSDTANNQDKPSIIGSRKRLAFLDMLLHAAKSAKLNQDDIREEVDTFMFEVSFIVT